MKKIIKDVVFVESILEYFVKKKNGMYSDMVWYELLEMVKKLKRPTKKIEVYLDLTLNIQKKDLIKIKKNYKKKLKETKKYLTPSI